MTKTNNINNVNNNKVNNDIEIFSNDEFGSIRTLNINGEPWFVGKDVAEVLGYERPTKAVSDRVEDDDIDGIPIQDSIGRMQNTPIINESGLYSLILSSKLPTAKKFKRWVTNEVLPSIRKHGVYATEMTIEKTLSDPDYIIQILSAFKKEKEDKEKLQVENSQQKEIIVNLNEQIKNDKPKIEFAQQIHNSKDTILVRELAKIISSNGVNIGERKLYSMLRDDGFLISKQGLDYNSPTQKSMNLGLFKVVESAVKTNYGTTKINRTTRVTPKGQEYLLNYVLKNTNRKSSQTNKPMSNDGLINPFAV